MDPTTAHEHYEGNNMRRINRKNYIRGWKLFAMKKNSVFLLSIVYFLLTTTSSCKYSNEYQTVNANNKFSISVPSWMKEDKALKEGADFQYANHFRNMYAIGETISKTDLKKSNAEIMNDNLSRLRKSMTNAVVSKRVQVSSKVRL